MSKQKVVVILGQTATGKSGLAVKIAKKFDGEIISADSRQVYRGLNIGTGKITKKEMRGIRHHMIDVASPKNQYSVARFAREAGRAVRDIVQRGKLPIVCGGTGLYIDAIVNRKIFPEVCPDEKLRGKLGKKTTGQLFEMLKKLDPRRAEKIDKNNPRRLIRAIEIAKVLGKVPTNNLQPTIYNALKIGLKLSDGELKKKIRGRLLSRMKKGMVAEIRRLHKNGLSWKRMEELGLEYRYLAKYLNKETTKEQMIAKLETKIWRYAKRQKTWFKRDKNIIWLNASDKMLGREAEITMHNFLTD
ncbi:MAG: tRNA (adenosine(37)-N6)-dimethylallyltransferase MiaA [Patescibacteria group bacterium]